MRHSVKKLVCAFACTLIILGLSIGIIVNASNSESVSNAFCTLYGFSYVEWDNYPQYYVDVISYTIDQYAYNVDQIQAVGDVFIDDVFIGRLDDFEFNTWQAEKELYSSGAGSILGIDSFHYANKSNFSGPLSTYTYDYVIYP